MWRKKALSRPFLARAGAELKQLMKGNSRGRGLEGGREDVQIRGQCICKGGGGSEKGRCNEVYEICQFGVRF